MEYSLNENFNDQYFPIQCDHLCGPGKQSRKVTCYTKDDNGKIKVLPDSHCAIGNETIPEKERSCQLRPCEGIDWVASEWSGVRKKNGVSEKFVKNFNFLVRG